MDVGWIIYFNVVLKAFFNFVAIRNEAIGLQYILRQLPLQVSDKAIDILAIFAFRIPIIEAYAMVFLHSEETLRLASIRVTAGTPMHQVMQDIESAWQRVIPEYPMQSEFLNETFDDTFTIFNLTTQVLGGFALIALLLSTIGLFGLAAFMAQNRTREIGIRKVMGANVVQIVRLLIWQFSKPVMWSLLVALPLAYFASNTYLNFFADRIAAPSGIVFGSGVAAVLFAWLIVAIHAIRIAHANPIKALRYE